MDQYFVLMGRKWWCPMSSEAAAFWFTKGWPVRLDGPYQDPPVNQHGIYTEPVKLPWEEREKQNG